VRAVQTAEIVASAAGFEGEVEVCPVLESGNWKPATLSKVLAGRTPEGSYALVGHNPDMERIASGLLRARGTTVPFGKGTVCLIELEGAPFEDPARFRWVLQAEDLKMVRSLLNLGG
jgi:phosphohistidine phosphatase SixA